MFVFNSNGRRPLPEDVICRAFDLTPAQCRLALALAQGETLREYADGAGISRNTARNHLAAIMAKLGISRQSELVCIITQLSSINPMK